ncbi:hypothetical protein BH09SUM1_BH09SUM1_08260 [soil metagenome]
MKFSFWKLSFLLLLALPVCEIYVLYRIGRAFDPWIPLFIVVGGAIVGGKLIRANLPKVLANGVAQIMTGNLAAKGGALDAGLLAFAGLLFAVPGVISDAFAILLLLPPVRFILKPLLLAAVLRKFTGGATASSPFVAAAFRQPAPPTAEPEEPPTPAHTPFDQPSPFDRLKR